MPEKRLDIPKKIGLKNSILVRVMAIALFSDVKPGVINFINHGAKIKRTKEVSPVKFMIIQSFYDKDISMNKSDCPIYLLTLKKIEDYLDPIPSNKKDGYLIADSMNKVPEEFCQIFKFLLVDLKDYKLPLN